MTGRFPTRTLDKVTRPMRTPLARSLVSTLALALSLLVSTRASAFQDGARTPTDDRPETPIEVNEWSIWVGNPGQPAINALKFYRNPMPSVVGTSRPRLEGEELAEQFPIAPVSIVQFFGEPGGDVDVDLRVKKGSILAHWPPGKEYTGRLHWFGSDLKAEPPANVPESYLPDDHWLHKLRDDASALYLRYESHYERFIAYDAELTIPIPLKLRGGPDEYTLQNLTNRRLVDVAVIAPGDDGLRVGWLDELPAATTDEQYLAALDRGLARVADEPGDVVVVSLGFDTYGKDPICDFALTTPVYHECGRRVAALGKRLVILQEGGYHVGDLGENARSWLRGADGRPFDPVRVTPALD
jgi:hypothetical protein